MPDWGSLHLELALAMRNIVVAKIRSFLAILGITIGTASVIALVSLGQLATQSALDAFRQLGTQVLAVHWTGKNFDNAFISTALRTRYSDLVDVLPVMNLNAPLHYQGHRISANLVASTDLLGQVGKFELTSGRLLSVSDAQQRHCVVGANVATKMVRMAGISPVGQWLRIGDYYYEVVGVLKPWKMRPFLMISADEMVWLPLPKVQADWQQHYIHRMILLFNDQVDVRQREVRVQVDVAQWSGKHRFFMHSPQALMQQIDEQQQRFRWLLGIMGGISLLVGGIGIMNLMLVVVSERRREVGIRLAIGASLGSLLRMFLLEAIALSCLGGTLGMVVGVVMTWGLAWMAQWPFHWLWGPLALGWVVSVVTGIFFGLYPAYQASRMHPIDALREGVHH